MEFNEKTVNKNYIYKGKILNLRKDDIILPNGKPAVREVIEHSGGSAVLCEKDGKILLVKQLRYPYKEVIYERGKCMLCLTSEDTLKLHPGELTVDGGVIVNGNPYGISPVKFAKVTDIKPLFIKNNTI